MIRATEPNGAPDAVTEPSPEQVGEWPRGWDEQRRHQLRRMAALPFSEKLDWLDEVQLLVDALASARNRDAARDRREPPGG